MELLHRSDRLRELLTVTKFALMLLASCIVTGCFTHVEDPDPPTTECTAPEDCPDTQHLCKMCWTTESINAQKRLASKVGASRKYHGVTRSGDSCNVLLRDGERRFVVLRRSR